MSRVALAVLLLATGLPGAAARAVDLDTGPSHQMIPARDGTPLAVVMAGPPAREGILFIHGFSMAAESFSLQLDSGLARQWRLVAFDMRGHGNSGKPWTAEAYRDSLRWAEDVETVREAAGLERMVLVGWSYGGQVAMDYLRHFGDQHVAAIELVGSLASLLPAGTVSYDPDHQRAGAANAARAVSLDLIERLTAAREFADRLTARPVSGVMRERLVVMPLLLPPHARQAMMGRALDNADLASSIRRPLRFSHGVHDALVPAAGVALLLQRMPTADAVSYAEAGHAPFIEEAAGYNERLLAFARQHLAPGSGRGRDDEDRARLP